MYKVWVSKMCLLLDTPLRAEVGGGHYLCYPWGVCWAAQKTAIRLYCRFCGFQYFKLYILAMMVGRPSLYGYDACVVSWVSGGIPEKLQAKNMVRPLSLLKWFFLFSRNPQQRFCGLVFWYLWIGRAKHPGPSPPHQLAVEDFNVAGWLTHGDLALDAGLDFLAVTEHRLIPARVRSDWAKLK